MNLAKFDQTAFLRDVWQRQPMLFRQAWTDWRNPLAPDDLAGLACEPEVESRLVIGGDSVWSVEHGPFEPQRFGKPGETPWTLLVQAVDHHVPEVAALISPFRFVPNWRIDDVMVSYASEGGGVGPHFDQYDVFLIQGLGQRRWRIGGTCDEHTPLIPHDDLRLIADFTATDEWILEPGDMLYLPPGLAHDGVAVGGDCMTYSIGFRAPSQRDLIEHLADDMLANGEIDDRYADPGMALQENPGEISSDALAQIRKMLADALLDPDRFARWFGRYTSTPKYHEIDWKPDDELSSCALRKALKQGASLERNPASRFAYTAGPSGTLLLFVDGDCHECSGLVAELAKLLCANEQFAISRAMADDAASLALIAKLCNQGSVVLVDD